MDEQRVVLDPEASYPLVISRSVYQGQVRLDVRRYYRADGELKPTKKGVSLTIEDGQAAQVMEAMAQLIQ